MRKLLIVFAIIASVVCFTGCKEEIDNVFLDLYSANPDSIKPGDPANDSCYTVLIESRTGPNGEIYNDYSLDSSLNWLGTYNMTVPSSYSDEDVERVLIDSIVHKKPLPENVSIKDIADVRRHQSAAH